MFYYYGGKISFVDRYPFPEYDLIVEPFAGGASYAVYHLYHGHAKKAILCEKDKRVYELWTRVLSMTADEIMSMPLPKQGDRTDDFLFMVTMASNATNRCKSLKVTERMEQNIPKMMRRIARELPFLKGKIEVINGDYQQLDNPDATWFIDPPYQIVGEPETTCRGMGYGKDCDAQSIDFPALGEWCKSRRGQVIVAEQSGANWLPFRFLHTRCDSQHTPKDEVIWTNREEPSLFD